MSDHEAIVPPSPEFLLALRLLPRIGPPLAQYFEERYERQLKRVTDVIESACDTSGVEPANLIEALSENERAADLLNQALTGAVDSSLRAKRRALGRVLAQVVEGDETTIDDSGLAIAALRNLESMHVAIMSRFFLHGAGPLLRDQSLDQIVRDKDEWISLEALVLQLQGWGLMERVTEVTSSINTYEDAESDIEADVEDRYRLTGLALRVLDLLREADKDGELQL
jgi:hypothetical protein